MMIIKRRTFLQLGVFLGFTCSVHAKGTKQVDRKLLDIKSLIESILEHMFPLESKLPSAKEMKIIDFVMQTVSEKSFDKDIRNFIIDGAKELDTRTDHKFIRLVAKEKEKALRSYEQSDYGSAWLSRIMVIAQEGMFSDPIYGANIQESGWKALQSYGGVPRAKSRYLEDV